MRTRLAMACSLSAMICLSAAGPAESAQKDGADSPRKSSAATGIRTVIDWLPADTQTLMVANGPIELWSADDDEAPQRDKRLLGTFQSIAMLPMGGLSEKQSKQLKGTTVNRALFGSRKFRPPHDIGMGSYEGCLILEFNADSIQTVSGMFENLLENAAEPDLLFGRRLVVLREGVDTTFVARPKKNLLLFATDRDFLKVIFHRMHSPEKEVAFPDRLPEWKHVDRKAAFWAIRHFDKSDIKEDYSSLLNPQMGRQGEGDPGAIGLAFDYQPADKTTVVVHYLSKSDNNETFAARRWWIAESESEESAVMPEVRKSGGFVYEIEHNLRNEVQTAYFILQFYPAFGFLVAI